MSSMPSIKGLEIISAISSDRFSQPTNITFILPGLSLKHLTAEDCPVSYFQDSSNITATCATLSHQGGQEGCCQHTCSPVSGLAFYVYWSAMQTTSPKHQRANTTPDLWSSMWQCTALPLTWQGLKLYKGKHWNRHQRIYRWLTSSLLTLLRSNND